MTDTKKADPWEQFLNSALSLGATPQELGLADHEPPVSLALEPTAERPTKIVICSTPIGRRRAF